MTMIVPSSAVVPLPVHRLRVAPSPSKLFCAVGPVSLVWTRVLSLQSIALSLDQVFVQTAPDGALSCRCHCTSEESERESIRTVRRRGRSPRPFLGEAGRAGKPNFPRRSTQSSPGRPRRSLCHSRPRRRPWRAVFKRVQSPDAFDRAGQLPGALPPRRSLAFADLLPTRRTPIYWQAARCYATAAPDTPSASSSAPPPVPEAGSAKAAPASPKIARIVDEIGGLTLLEAAELVDALKVRSPTQAKPQAMLSERATYRLA